MFKIEFTDTEKVFDLTAKINIPIDKITEEIRHNIEENLKQPKSFDNSTLTPLKKNAYWKRKVKTGHTKIFDGLSTNNKLVDAVKSKIINSSESEIYIDSSKKQNSKTTNAEVMYYLQQGKFPLAGQRRAFGITEKTLKKIDKLLSDIKI